MAKDILAFGSTDIESRVMAISLLHIIFGVLFIINFDSDNAYGFEFYYILLPPLIVQILISFIMIIGTIPRKLSFIFPFVCMCFGNIITFIPIAIAHLIYLGINLRSEELWFANLGISIIKTAGGYIYFFIMAFSFYQIVLREKFSPVKTDKTPNKVQLETVSVHI
ncbi:hypothetical protein PV325_001905 [Microctonus aethiopoides]|nr:hypothetical protein PV325_001905 [Microctonus aethiopoides]KAK0095298.1 hypothetical protein PV326_008727 [Microctonus aethiopoides]